MPDPLLLLLEKFFAHPGPRNYLRVREQLLAQQNAAAHSTQLVKLLKLFKAGQFRRLRRAIDEMMPERALAPAVYWLGACAAKELDEQLDAETDRFGYDACLRGILATGDGSENRPFWITYSSDIDEVLLRLQVEREQIELLRGKRGLCDVVSCESGERLWFALGEGIRDQCSLTARLQTANSSVR